MDRIVICGSVPRKSSGLRLEAPIQALITMAQTDLEVHPTS